MAAPKHADAQRGARSDSSLEATAPPVLHGERVTLRPLREVDRVALEAILDEPAVARWWRRGEWERVVVPGAITYAIEEARRLLGMIQFEEHLDPDYRRAAVDIFLCSAAQGRGLGRDAIRTLVRYLFDVRGHHRITMDPAVENERAVRCYQSVGFCGVGVMRQYERIADGTYRDALLMELVNDGQGADAVADTLECRVRRFFEAYAARFAAALADTPRIDAQATAAAFADSFVLADHAGAVCGRNDNAFLEQIPVGFQFYRRLGIRTMCIVLLRVTPLDERHALAQVLWRAHYERAESNAGTIEFPVTYVLQELGAGPRILLAMTGDEQRAYRERGLI